MRLPERLRNLVSPGGRDEVEEDEGLGPIPELPSDPAPVPEPRPEDRFPVPSFLSALRSDGQLDLDRISRESDAPRVTMSADQAIEVLRRLPEDVTPAARYRAMKQALGAQIDERIPELVTDAAHKMVDLNRFLTSAQSENAAFRTAVGAEIARLEETVARLSELMGRTSLSANQVLAAARKRVDHMTGIIAFFDEFQAMYHYEQETGRNPYDDPAAADAPAEESPPFLQDENVLRLLGVSQSDRNAA